MASSGASGGRPGERRRRIARTKGPWVVSLVVILALFSAGCRGRGELVTLDEFDQPEPAAGEAAAAPDSPAQEDERLLIVHVTGAVARPGVYRLKAGARANDAVELAGGLAEGASLTAVNLASRLEDGQQLYIPTEREAAGAVAAGRAGAPEPDVRPNADHPVPGPSGRGGPTDLNSASAEALQRLPGIGPVLAARIVADRAANGPYTSLDDLLRVSGIGNKKLAALRDHCVVR